MIDIAPVFEKYQKQKIYLEFIKSIKTGKEAAVFLVTDVVNKNKYALKVYKNLDVRSFQNRDIYLEGLYIDKPSLRHAVKNKTKLGQEYIQERWILQEVQTLKKLNKINALIPLYKAHTYNSVLMEFLGTNLEDAPRLSDITLDRNDVTKIFDDILGSIENFLKLGFTHGDLSEYNILLHKKRAYLIDFPQITNFRTNHNALIIFERDLEKIETYFKTKYNFENLNKTLKLKTLAEKVFLKGV